MQVLALCAGFRSFLMVPVKRGAGLATNFRSFSHLVLAYLVAGCLHFRDRNCKIAADLVPFLRLAAFARRLVQALETKIALRGNLPLLPLMFDRNVNQSAETMIARLHFLVTNKILGMGNGTGSTATHATTTTTTPPQRVV